MRSCVTVFLALLGLSMVMWLGWEPVGDFALQLRERWWGNRPTVTVVEPDLPAIESVPTTPLPPPVFPVQQTSALRTIRVIDSIDVPYRELGGSFDFNQVVEEYVDIMYYYDTEVLIRNDTIPSRGGVLFEVIDLENSDIRDFYMWNTFNLTLYHEMLPNSVMRVHADLSGVYRERAMSGGWNAAESEQIEARMTGVLQSDIEHLLLSLDNKLRREVGSFIAW